MDTGRWVYRGAYGGRRYNWPQCRYCGRAANRDCTPYACELCGTVQCQDNSRCIVCYLGRLGHWLGNRSATCDYKGCNEKAVADCRKRAVCIEHAKRIKAHKNTTLAELVAERLAHRDSGKGWEQFRFVEMEGAA